MRSHLPVALIALALLLTPAWAGDTQPSGPIVTQSDIAAVPRGELDTMRERRASAVKTAEALGPIFDAAQRYANQKGLEEVKRMTIQESTRPGCGPHVRATTKLDALSNMFACMGGN